jgi:hypothetical protein
VENCHAWGVNVPSKVIAPKLPSQTTDDGGG